MTLSEKLKAIREAKGMTRTEVEKKSGISYSCIKELENGSSNPTLFTLEVLCACYGVKLWEVLNPEPQIDVNNILYQLQFERANQFSNDWTNDEYLKEYISGIDYAINLIVAMRK